MKPWLSNYVASIHNCDEHAELYGLSVLARNTLLLCDRERIVGHSFNERLCRVVLKRIRRFADFTQLADRSGVLKQIKDCQNRLEGLLIK